MLISSLTNLPRLINNAQLSKNRQHLYKYGCITVSLHSDHHINSVSIDLFSPVRDGVYCSELLGHVLTVVTSLIVLNLLIYIFINISPTRFTK